MMEQQRAAAEKRSKTNEIRAAHRFDTDACHREIKSKKERL